MANTKISALPAAGGAGLLDAHELPVNEAGVTKKVTGIQIRTKADAVSAAADHLARIKLAADSAYRAWLGLNASDQGSLEFGGGAGARDLRVLWAGPGTLTLDANGQANQTAFVQQATAGQRNQQFMLVAGDGQFRVALGGDATQVGLEFGSGGAVRDVRYFRTGAKAASIDDGAAGAIALNIIGALLQSGVPIPAYANASTANQQLSGATDQYITNSKITVPTGKLRLGSILHWRFAIDKTGAGTAAPVFKVFVGTLGTTGDTARLTFTLPAQTGVIDTGFVDITVTCRGPLSSAGVFQGILELQHNLAATGLSNIANPVIAATSAAFDVTTAGLFVGVACNPGLNGVWNFQQVIADTLNL